MKATYVYVASRGMGALAVAYYVRQAELASCRGHEVYELLTRHWLRHPWQMPRQVTVAFLHDDACVDVQASLRLPSRHGQPSRAAPQQVQEQPRNAPPLSGAVVCVAADMLCSLPRPGQRGPSPSMHALAGAAVAAICVIAHQRAAKACAAPPTPASETAVCAAAVDTRSFTGDGTALADISRSGASAPNSQALASPRLPAPILIASRGGVTPEPELLFAPRTPERPSLDGKPQREAQPRSSPIARHLEASFARSCATERTCCDGAEAAETTDTAAAERACPSAVADAEQGQGVLPERVVRAGVATLPEAPRVYELASAAPAPAPAQCPVVRAHPTKIPRPCAGARAATAGTALAQHVHQASAARSAAVQGGFGANNDMSRIPRLPVRAGVGGRSADHVSGSVDSVGGVVDMQGRARAQSLAHTAREVSARVGRPPAAAAACKASAIDHGRSSSCAPPARSVYSPAAVAASERQTGAGKAVVRRSLPWVPPLRREPLRGSAAVAAQSLKQRARGGQPGGTERSSAIEATRTGRVPPGYDERAPRERAGDMPVRGAKTADRVALGAAVTAAAEASARLRAGACCSAKNSSVVSSQGLAASGVRSALSGRAHAPGAPKGVRQLGARAKGGANGHSIAEKPRIVGSQAVHQPRGRAVRDGASTQDRARVVGHAGACGQGGQRPPQWR